MESLFDCSQKRIQSTYDLTDSEDIALQPLSKDNEKTYPSIDGPKDSGKKAHPSAGRPKDNDKTYYPSVGRPKDNGKIAYHSAEVTKDTA